MYIYWYIVISFNFPVLLLCYMVCISYSMKTFLVMVKGNRNSVCREKVSEILSICFPLTLLQPSFFSKFQISGLNFCYFLDKLQSLLRTKTEWPEMAYSYLYSLINYIWHVLLLILKNHQSKSFLTLELGL